MPTQFTFNPLTGEFNTQSNIIRSLNVGPISTITFPDTSGQTQLVETINSTDTSGTIGASQGFNTTDTTTGYDAINFYGNNVFETSMYVIPASVSVTPHLTITNNAAQDTFTIRTDTGNTYLAIQSGQSVAIGTGDTTTAPETKLDLHGEVQFRGEAAPAVSSSGNGRVYFDSTSNTLKLSKNGGAYVDILTATETTARYVDFDSGSDTDGDGSAVNPWLTLQHAYDSITDASTTKYYTINISGIITDTLSVTGKPNIMLNGLGFANMAFSDGGHQGTSLTITGGFDNDFISLTNIGLRNFTWIRNDATFPNLTINNCTFGPQIDFEQNGSGGAFLTITSSNLSTNTIFGSGNGGVAELYGNTCQQLTFNDSSGSLFIISGCYFGQPILVSGGSTLQMAGNQVDIIAGYLLNLTQTANGSPTVQTDSSSTPNQIISSGSYTILGRDCTVLAGADASMFTNAVLVANNGHIKSTQTTAPTTTTDANAGTGATSSVAHATDSAGQLTLTTGSLATASGIQTTVNFNKVYNVAPIVVITPANNNASLDSVVRGIFVTSTTSGFSINFSVAETVGTTYTWNYKVIETQ